MDFEEKIEGLWTGYQAIDMKMIFFYSHANDTHFHKKDCAHSLILKVGGFGTWKIMADFNIIVACPIPKIISPF